MKMIIKPYNEEYFLPVRNLRNSDEVGRVSNRYTVKGSDLFCELLEGDYRVAIINNVFAGYVGVRQPDNEVCVNVVKRFYRHGVASALLEDVIKDYDYLTAEVLYDNVASHNLFKNKGFDRIKTVYERGDGR